jgi:two-component system phosphate regulon response regulator PhoB
MSTTILAVDDEPDVLDLLDFTLKQAGYRVEFAEDGNQALTKARQTLPDLILLDWMLPEMEGLEVCKLLRRDPATSTIPIIMLTAKATEVDRILGFELGADDYVTKPFSPRELVLRIKAILSRGRGAAKPVAEQIEVGELIVDVPGHQVIWKGKPIDLTATEFKLLHVLAERRGRVQSREVLLQDVWNYESMIDTRTVDTHVRRLREKLGEAEQYIETVRGVGYRFATS